MRVLIGDAAWQGSTAGIARRNARVLERAGDTAEAVSAGSVEDLPAHDAVVVGSAVHDQSWLPEAADFVRRNTAALSERPVWSFGAGMSGGLSERLRRTAHAGQDRSIAAALHEDVQPRGHRAFSGVCRPELFPRRGRVLFRAVGGHVGGCRDWPAIGAWAQQIGQELSVRPASEGR